MFTASMLIIFLNIVFVVDINLSQYIVQIFRTPDDAINFSTTLIPVSLIFDTLMYINHGAIKGDNNN